MNQRILEAGFLGRIPYQEGLELQEEQVTLVRDQNRPEALFLLEHDPVLTLGRNARKENIIAPEENLRALGIQVYECGRGGDVTYHGPGQLVGYPIINLSPDRKDVGKFVRNLEDAIIRTLDDYGVRARQFQGLTGVWVGDKKIAAIGIRISRWVTSHGFALNVTTNLDHFQTIIPCGIRNYGVTSLAQLMSEPPPLADLGKTMAGHFAKIFGRKLSWSRTPGTVGARVLS